MSLLLSGTSQSDNIYISIHHYNQSIKKNKDSFSIYDIWEPLTYAFESLIQEFCIIKGYENHPTTVTPKLLSEGLSIKSHRRILSSNLLQDLISFNDLIMDHDILIKGDYRPGEEINPSLHKKSIFHHKKLINAFNRYQDDVGNIELSEAAIKKLGKLLYTVRSNASHGGKTPYGPDEEKVRRDKRVLTIFIPILKMLIDEIYGNPQNKLFVYGTLIPGRENHQILKDVEGNWGKFSVNGSIVEIDGLKYFQWIPKEKEIIEGQLFESNNIIKYWKEIDRFEGQKYERQLACQKERDNLMVFTYYAKNQDNSYRRL